MYHPHNITSTNAFAAAEATKTTVMPSQTEAIRDENLTSSNSDAPIVGSFALPLGFGGMISICLLRQHVLDDRLLLFSQRSWVKPWSFFMDLCAALFIMSERKTRVAVADLTRTGELTATCPDPQTSTASPPVDP